MANEQDIPIDIHSSKLFDWLVSRRLCSKDWQQAVVKVRELISHAIQDMPEHPKVVELLSGTTINYFNCRQIVEILHETEKDSKNIFGFYSSQRVKDWQEIVDAYEKDGLYLAESSVVLQRLVQYEVPAIKKNIQRGYTQSEECARKQVDYHKQAKEAVRVFEQECSKLGIDKNGNLRNELISLARGIPEYFEKIVQNTNNIKDSIEYYARFRRYVSLNADASDDQVLPMLSYVMAHGNVTTYEWQHGTAPKEIQAPAQLHMDEEHNNDDDTIDFGDDGAGGEIDFGDFEVAGSENGHDQIDFGIETVGETGDTLLITEPVMAEGGVARGEMALSVLENPKTQAKFMDDLIELSVFLNQRMAECEQEQSAGDLVLASHMATDAAFSKLMVDIKKDHSLLVNGYQEGSKQKGQMLSAWSSEVYSLRAMLTDPNKRHLFKIRANARYLDTLTEQLSSKRSQISRYEQLARLMGEKSDQSSLESDQLKPQLQTLAERTKVLQKEIEHSISVKYKNRPVNIMGGITAALAATS